VSEQITNVVIAGLGGQGVLKASDILADAACRAGYDVKKSELHGMSQRGGSVSSDVRFGSCVWSPMVPPGQAAYLVVLDPTQVEINRWMLAESGTLITPEAADEIKLASKKGLNVALMGALSAHLPIPVEAWQDAIRAALPAKLHESNLNAFAALRAATKTR
jgi:indolepyruvate ferredoxin oxidoreductase, beta subunit